MRTRTGDALLLPTALPLPTVLLLLSALLLATLVLAACDGSTGSESGCESGCEGGCEGTDGTAPDPILDVLSRRHTEVGTDSEGHLRQTFFPGDGIGLCFHVDPRIDTSRWRGLLRLDGVPTGGVPTGGVPTGGEQGGGHQPPTARSGGVICFDSETLPTATMERMPEVPTEGKIVELCAELVDDFDGRTLSPPCITLLLRPSDAARQALRQRRQELLSGAWERPVAEVIEDFDVLVKDARQAGFPAFAAHAELLVLHFLAREGTDEARADIRRRLDALPEWIDGIGASLVGAAFSFQRSLRATHEGRRSDAWRHLAIAEERYRRIAKPRLVAVLGMTEILSKAGALREATDRLADALAECEELAETAGRAVCPGAWVQSGRTNRAWWTLLDEDADTESLEQARSILRASLDQPGENDPLEIPNLWLNLAYLRLRLGEDPTEPLAEARRRLEQHEAGGERRRDLLAWARLVEARALLAKGEPADALRHCSALSADPEPRLAAMAASCAGRAHRALGRAEAAADAFEKALLRHEAAFDWQLGRGLPLGPGQRAEDFARAARVAVEAGRPGAAWELLRRLDRLSLAEAARRRCREQAENARDRQRWQELEAESASILDTLRQLDGPASAERQRERERSITLLETRLRNLWRDWPGCQPPAAVDDGGVDHRAVALDDQVLLLHRDGEGVRARLTDLDRQQVRQSLAELDRLAPHSADGEEWRRWAAPLAAALAPDVPLPEKAVYALHGLLQETPLLALPVDGGWLGRRTRVSVRPAGSRALSAAADSVSPGSRRPVFVIDPSNNLAAASAMAGTYRSLFPDARFLRGAEARHQVVVDMLGEARWLHVDAHGIYDRVTPELSALRMADRPLHWLELADTSPRLRFANLSGCQTGRWPITADSGTYGLAGLLTRLGVPWAVGSRTNLPDDTASDFNRIFYERVAEGAGPDTAFADALASIMDRHPPAAWSGLVLFEASGARPGPENVSFAVSGGQSESVETPEAMEPGPSPELRAQAQISQSQETIP